MILIIGGRNQGKTAFALSEFKDRKIINGFHMLMKEQLKSERPTEELERAVLEADVVISDEIGCGIVPLDAFDRKWREETGRALCRLAQNAEAVYRVCAGIAQRIK